MKRLASLLLVLLCAVLAGCSWLLPTEYTDITPHAITPAVPQDADIPQVSDYAALRRAIAGFAANGVTHGVIRTADYDGSVEEDLPRAAYSVAREDPVGAYAIDFLTHECSLIVSYYEITIDITFRDMAADPRELTYVSNQLEVKSLLAEAMDTYADHVTWYAVGARGEAYDALAREIYVSDPRHYMALPDIRVTNYPEDGKNRIVELTLTWPDEAAALKKMEQAVDESLQAASVYVRYRDTDWEKLDLLYTYLLERFSYLEQPTDTPLYSALCEGLLTSQSAATAWQLLCDQLGIACQTVSGSWNGSEYFWNILTLDGLSYHVDLLRDLLESDALTLRYDEDMTGYSWDAAAVPACPKPEPVAVPEAELPALDPEHPAPEGEAESPESNPTDENAESEKTEPNFTRRS